MPCIALADSDRPKDVAAGERSLKCSLQWHFEASNDMCSHAEGALLTSQLKSKQAKKL